MLHLGFTNNIFGRMKACSTDPALPYTPDDSPTTKDPILDSLGSLRLLIKRIDPSPAFHKITQA